MLFMLQIDVLIYQTKKTKDKFNMCIFFCRNTAVQSKTALAVAAFVCDADSRENVSQRNILFFKLIVRKIR